MVPDTFSILKFLRAKTATDRDVGLYELGELLRSDDCGRLSVPNRALAVELTGVLRDFAKRADPRLRKTIRSHLESLDRLAKTPHPATAERRANNRRPAK